MPSQEEMFNFLKKDGECFHDLEFIMDRGYKCQNCNEEGEIVDFQEGDKAEDDFSVNPDFTTPEGMMWILERLKNWILHGPDKHGKYLMQIWINDGKDHIIEEADTLPQAVLNAVEKMVEVEGE